MQVVPKEKYFRKIVHTKPSQVGALRAENNKSTEDLPNFEQALPSRKPQRFHISVSRCRINLELSMIILCTQPSYQA